MGIFGYSFTSFLIPVLLCAMPYNGLQWIVILYAAIVSCGFLIAAFWQDFKSNLDGNKRWIAILILCLVHMTLLFVFKLYFFDHFTKDLHLLPAKKIADPASTMIPMPKPDKPTGNL